MTHPFLKAIFCLVALGTASCTWKGSQAQEPVKLHRHRIDFIGKNRVRLEFHENAGNQLLVTIEWTHTPQGEYSTVGPLKKISIERNGNTVPVAPTREISSIEDVDLNSCQIYQQGDGYILEAYWGAGESLAHPQKISLIRTKS